MTTRFSTKEPQFQNSLGHWCCGECKQELHQHLPTCETDKEFREWYKGVLAKAKALQEQPRPSWMCPGCPLPKDGSQGHKFSCVVGGARASQVVLPAFSTITPDGKVVFTIPKPPEEK